ncbi:hypothetical protein TRVA0_017S01992 [Trichomonascus vanleenenianus]|uniref:uncharacterized protein n=1 Tax=Trichomonascus vanleenenianus TaxID=2268995 RepID=UPI003EC9C73A
MGSVKIVLGVNVRTAQPPRREEKEIPILLYHRCFSPNNGTRQRSRPSPWRLPVFTISRQVSPRSGATGVWGLAPREEKKNAVEELPTLAVLKRRDVRIFVISIGVGRLNKKNPGGGTARKKKHAVHIWRKIKGTPSTLRSNASIAATFWQFTGHLTLMISQCTTVMYFLTFVGPLCMAGTGGIWAGEICSPFQRWKSLHVIRYSRSVYFSFFRTQSLCFKWCATGVRVYCLWRLQSTCILYCLYCYTFYVSLQLHVCRVVQYISRRVCVAVSPINSAANASHRSWMRHVVSCR